jgi:hypothetical protein
MGLATADEVEDRFARTFAPSLYDVLTGIGDDETA